MKEFVENNNSDRKNRIVKAALELITTEGFTSMNLDEVVTRAGTSKSAIYSLFKNKEGLLKELCNEVVFKVRDEMIGSLSLETPAAEILHSLVQSYLRRSTTPEYQAIIHTINSELRNSEDIGKHYFEVGPARVLKNIVKFLEYKVAEGELAIPDCELAAKQFIGSIVWFRFAKSNYTQVNEDDLEVALYEGRVAVDAFLRAYSV